MTINEGLLKEFARAAARADGTAEADIEEAITICNDYMAHARRFVAMMEVWEMISGENVSAARIEAAGLGEKENFQTRVYQHADSLGE
jgi:hypothetical protein